MKLSKVWVALWIGVTFFACKKKDTEPSVKDLLTAHIWIGETLQYDASVSGLPVNSDVLAIDSSAVEFTKNNEVVFYRRNVTNGNVTEVSRQAYTLSSDNKKIESPSIQGLITGDLKALIDSFGIQIPTTIDIDKITKDELILKGRLQQVVSNLPGIPSVPGVTPTLTVNYTIKYRK
jgi:hypothetical protein